MFLDNFYHLLGYSMVVFAIIFIIIFSITIILGKILIKKKKFIFPKLLLFILDIFYIPIKKLAQSLNFDDYLIDQISVGVRNKVNKSKFDSIPNDKKLIFFPHCLRHRDCEAVLNENGLICTDCNKCSIGVIKSKAEEIGYRIYIVPGSSFVKKLLKNSSDFQAVLGVACYEDLSQMMRNLSDFAPQGILLTRTGCFETKVDIKAVLDKIGYKKEERRKRLLEMDDSLCIKIPEENQS